MYTRIPSGRYPRGMRVPENYGGSAFRPLPSEPPPEEEPPQAPVTERAAPSPIRHEPPHARSDDPSPEAPPEPHVPAGRFSFGLPFFRRDNTGVDFEDLLLIGLILLVAQEGKNDDLIWLLVLLLLIR